MNAVSKEEAMEWFYMWWQDGSNQTAIHGRRELRRMAKRFDFDPDEVIRSGETSMLDEDNDPIGGVYKWRTHND